MDIILRSNSLILMSSNNHTKEQAREFLKQHALNEISDITDFTRFHTRVYYIVAKYGLQVKAKEDQFFSGDEWDNPACKAALIKKTEQFLDRYIK